MVNSQHAVLRVRVSVAFPWDDVLVQLEARAPCTVIDRRSCRNSILLSGFTAMLLSPYSFENLPCCQGSGKTVEL